MIHVSISEEIAKACPELHIAVVQCDVVNTASDEQLWKEITEVETLVRCSCKLEEIISPLSGQPGRLINAWEKTRIDTVLQRKHFADVSFVNCPCIK